MCIRIVAMFEFLNDCGFPTEIYENRPFIPICIMGRLRYNAIALIGQLIHTQYNYAVELYNL
jgi:hypothetical protein